jgi:hypothetical protein
MGRAKSYRRGRLEPRPGWHRSRSNRLRASGRARERAACEHLLKADFFRHETASCSGTGIFVPNSIHTGPLYAYLSNALRGNRRRRDWESLL